MRIDSGKKAVFCGSVRGVLVVFLCIVFTCCLSILTGGENFITAYGKAASINGIDFDFVKISGFVLAMVMCWFCSYSSFRLMMADIGSCLLTYLLCTMLIFAILIKMPILLDKLYALNSYDYIHYVFVTFPAGLISGSVIKIIYYSIKIRMHKNDN